MEPNYNNYSSAELPQPLETTGLPQEQSAPSQPEVRGTKMPVSQPASQQDAAVSQSSVQTPVPAPPMNTTVPLQANDAATTLMADDTDLIEKEWVTRAKSIVMQTKNDPYLQNREMSKVKADYLKKRYNKDLKVSEN